MIGPLRRVVIDEGDATYVSEGPELVADAPAGSTPSDDCRLADEPESLFEDDVAKLREQDWSVARIAHELYASEDEVRAALPIPYGDPDWDRDPRAVYGLEPEAE